MRKSLVIVALLGLSVILSSVTARAQTGIIAGTTTGNGDLLGTNGYYSITGGPVTLTLGNFLTNVFADYNAAGTLSFSDTTGSGGAGTVLLAGTLSLVDLAQTFSTGVTDTSLAANVTITGGSLMAPGEPYANGDGIGQLTLNLSGLGYLPTSAGGTASLSVGTLNPATIDPAPELNSMLLFGTGLVVFGAILRRRLVA